MKGLGIHTTEMILDRFVEGLFRLMLDHHRTQVVEMDLTVAQAQALRLLRDTPVSTSRLAAALGISAPAMTQLTDRLLRKHLIERRAVEADRRSVMVALTEKGRGVVDRFRLRRNEVFGEALLRLSNEDRAEVIDALSKVAAALDAFVPQHVKHLGEPEQLPSEQTETRTAVHPAKASKEVGQSPSGLPRKRRMRMEWD